MISIKAAKGEDIEEKDDLDKQIEVWKKDVTADIKQNPRRSNQISVDLYENTIKQIFDEIKLKVQTFDELFQRSNTIQRYQIGNLLTNNVSVLKKLNKSSKDLLTEVLLEVIFENLLNKPEEQNKSIRYKLSWKLEEFDYNISINEVTEEKYSKNYSQKLNELETNELINTFISQLFEGIKQLMS